MLLVGPVEYPPDYCLREDGTAIVWGYEVDRLRNSPAGEQFVQIAAAWNHPWEIGPPVGSFSTHADPPVISLDSAAPT